MGNKRTFTPEFKKEPSSLVLQACEAMDVSESAMRRWVKQLKAERDGQTPTGCRAFTTGQQQIQALQKQVRKLDREKEILKKASALLVLDMYQSTP